MAAQAFVRPENFDSATVRIRESFIALRDTLHSITAGSARLQRDLQSASGPVLVSHARVVRNACSNSLKGVDGAREGMFAGRPVTDIPLTRRTALDRSFIQLRAALVQCAADFSELSAAGQGQRIRDVGMSRLLPSREAIRNFEAAGDIYLRSLRVRVRPFGAGESPLAGGGSPTPSH